MRIKIPQLRQGISDLKKRTPRVMPHAAEEFLRPSAKVDRHGVIGERLPVCLAEDDTAARGNNSASSGVQSENRVKSLGLDVPEALLTLSFEKGCYGATRSLPDDVIRI